MSAALPRRLVLGHRGASAAAPENTMAAFRRALAEGADGIELDVQRAADGVPVVIHDLHVDRTTDGTGAVADLPAAALARLDAGGGEAVPTLAEVAAWAARTGAWLNVELKAPGAEDAALRILREAALLERTIFSSFDPEIVAEVGRLDASATRFFLTEAWDEAVRAEVARCGAGGVCLHVDAATPAALAGLRAAALPVVVWTVDDPRRVAELLRADVVAVISNVPGAAVAAREALDGG